MVITLLGTHGLFSSLQVARTDQVSPNRISITQHIHNALYNFRWLATDVTIRPTCITKLVPLDLSIVGAHDQLGLGSGRIFFAANHLASRNSIYKMLPSYDSMPNKTLVIDIHSESTNLVPDLHSVSNTTVHPTHYSIIWKMFFPDFIRNHLILFYNPIGSVKNPELELASSVIHHDAM